MLLPGAPCRRALRPTRPAPPGRRPARPLARPPSARAAEAEPASAGREGAVRVPPPPLRPTAAATATVAAAFRCRPLEGRPREREAVGATLPPLPPLPPQRWRQRGGTLDSPASLAGRRRWESSVREGLNPPSCILQFAQIKSPRSCAAARAARAPQKESATGPTPALIPRRRTFFGAEAVPSRGGGPPRRAPPRRLARGYTSQVAQFLYRRGPPLRPGRPARDGAQRHPDD